MVALWGSLAFQWFNSGVIGRLGSEEHVFFFSAFSPLSGRDLAESLNGIGDGKEIVFIVNTSS